MWELKRNQPPFEMVDGPMAGSVYKHGRAYEEVPAGHEHRFEHSGEAIIAAMGDSADDGPSVIYAQKKKDEKEVADA